MQTTISINAFATHEPPVFETKEAERRHVRERLAAACRILGRRGLSEGLLGHVTVRDPELTDCFWVNPVGTPMHRVKASQLVQVDHQGRVDPRLASLWLALVPDPVGGHRSKRS